MARYDAVGVSVDMVCLNGGTCRDVGESHRCECRPGFEGSYCDQDVDECRSQPCRNGARCVDLVGRYHCDCPLGFQVLTDADVQLINRVVTHLKNLEKSENLKMDKRKSQGLID